MLKVMVYFATAFLANLQNVLKNFADYMPWESGLPQFEDKFALLLSGVTRGVGVDLEKLAVLC